MTGAIIILIIGILVMAILPNFLSGTKRSKAKRKKVLICKIIGWLLIFLGIYDALSVLLGAYSGNAIPFSSAEAPTTHTESPV